MEQEKAAEAANRGRRTSEIELTKFGLKKVEHPEVCAQLPW